MISNHCGHYSSDLDNISPYDPWTEIADIEKSIAELIKRRSELKRNINRTYSPFISRIPPEIIAKISVFATTDFTIIKNLPAPLLLSSVCDDWRRIVVGTPELWSSMTIDLPNLTENMPYKKECRLATFIDEWLARSGQLPLHISLNVPFGDYYHQIPDSFTRYQAIFKVLNRYSSRWHSLDVSSPTCLFPCLQPDDLPLLEQFNIKASAYKYYSGITTLTFPPSPCLKKLKIVLREGPSPLCNMKIQWDNITYLYLDGFADRDCLELLRQIPQLVHVTFRRMLPKCEYGRAKDSLPKSPILSHLTYLYLSHYHKGNSLDQIFDSLLLPSLRTLVLSGMKFKKELMIAFLERCACSLYSLSLEDLDVGYKVGIIQLLEYLSPSLIQLEMASTYGVGDYLEVLADIYSSQSAMKKFLPHLEVFKCRYGSRELKLSKFRNFSKLDTPIPLQSVHLELPTVTKIPANFSSFLELLRGGGTMVTLTRFEDEDVV